MLTNRIENLVLAAGLAMLVAAGCALDGPDEVDAARASALSLQDAQRMAGWEAQQARSNHQIAEAVCERMHGQRAMLVSLRETGGQYVCKRKESV